MKQTQLMLKFSRNILRHLRLTSEASPPARGRTPAHLSREPLLEALGRQLLRAAGCRDLELNVFWNTRLRTTAGLACWSTKTISLNPKLAEVSQAEVQRTLRHELAHFLAQYRSGRRRISAHGDEWRKACKDLGIPDEARCHNLPFRRVRMERKYFYACRECGTTLARVRRVKNRLACLKCCRRHNDGKYHERFRFVQVAPPDRLAA